MPYDTLKDLCGQHAHDHAVRDGRAAVVQGHSVGEVIALAKSKPDSLSIGHGGNGTAMHLTALLFNHMAGVNVTLVPYRGSALGSAMSLPAYSARRRRHHRGIGGDPVGPGEAARVSSRKRDPSLPDVPSFAESGLPGYEAMAGSAWSSRPARRRMSSPSSTRRSSAR